MIRPVACCLVRRSMRAVSAMVSLIASMRAGLPAGGGDGRVAERDAQGSVADVVLAVVACAGGASERLMSPHRSLRIALRLFVQPVNLHGFWHLSGSSRDGSL